MTQDDTSESHASADRALRLGGSSLSPNPPSAATEVQVPQMLDEIAETLAQTQRVVVLLENLVPAAEAREALTRLQPAMRHAEQAMHRLRQSGWGQNTASTNLSQHLTVLVLVIDMLLAGQLVGANRAESHDLLGRNLASAQNSVAELRTLLDQSSTSGK